MNVKDVSKLLGISPHTIRYYTDRNLIPDLKRGAYGLSIFDDISINWLIGIINLKVSGMSLKSIEEYIELCKQGDETIPQRFEIIKSQMINLEKKMREINNQYEYMKEKLKLYERIMNNELEDISNPREWTKK